jgi:hypothetical protein
MASKYIKKCSSSLVIKEMQIKTILRFHPTPIRMSTSRARKITNAGEGKRGKEKRMIEYL